MLDVPFIATSDAAATVIPTFYGTEIKQGAQDPSEVSGVVEILNLGLPFSGLIP